MRFCSFWFGPLTAGIVIFALALFLHGQYFVDGRQTNTLDKSNQPWPLFKRPFPFKIQSPNNIHTKNVKSDLCLAPLCVQKTVSLPEEAITIKNTGSTLEVLLRDQSRDKRPTITGGPLFNDCYLFEQLHFHWGRNDSCGSEHRLDGKCYSTEIHAVFFNDKYSSFEAAKNYSDGVTVVSFFGEHSKHDNLDFTHLVKKLTSVKEPGSEVRGSFKKELGFVKILLQQSKYYAFPGSLTTGDYQECVTWIMFTNPFSISNKQLNTFRRLMREDGRGMIRENDRELQAFGNRPIITPLINEGIQVIPMDPESPYFLKDECPPNPCNEK